MPNQSPSVARKTLLETDHTELRISISSLEMLSLILTAVIPLLGVILYWNFRSRYRFADKWPTLRPVYPLVGNAPIVLGKNEIERFETIRDVCISADRILKVWAGPKLLLVTSHPDLIQQILTSPVCLEKPYLYRFAGFEEGLFTAKCMWLGKGTRVCLTSIWTWLRNHRETTLVENNTFSNDTNLQC